MLPLISSLIHGRNVVKAQKSHKQCMFSVVGLGSPTRVIPQTRRCAFRSENKLTILHMRLSSRPSEILSGLSSYRALPTRSLPPLQSLLEQMPFKTSCAGPSFKPHQMLLDTWLNVSLSRLPAEWLGVTANQPGQRNQCFVTHENGRSSKPPEIQTPTPMTLSSEAVTSAEPCISDVSLTNVCRN